MDILQKVQSGFLKCAMNSIPMSADTNSSCLLKMLILLITGFIRTITKRDEILQTVPCRWRCLRLQTQYIVKRWVCKAIMRLKPTRRATQTVRWTECKQSGEQFIIATCACRKLAVTKVTKGACRLPSCTENQARWSITYRPSFFIRYKWLEKTV